MMIPGLLNWAATKPGVRRMPDPTAPPTMTAIPNPTPRMRSRCPFGRLGERVVGIPAGDYSPVSALKTSNDSGWFVGYSEAKVGWRKIAITLIDPGCELQVVIPMGL